MPAQPAPDAYSASSLRLGGGRRAGAGGAGAYIDRQVVAIVVDPMKADLGVNDAQIGWLYGVFAVFYAIAALPIAWLADRKSRKFIIAAGIFFWSLMTVACGLSRSFWHVLLARIGVGVERPP